MKSYKQYIKENDAEHQKALNDTGFWGSRGAGCIILAKDTKRILIAHRSASVEQPHTWGTWGGAIDKHETPEDAIHREVQEEAGYYGHLSVVPLMVFSSGSFRYYNFLAIVDKEFHPHLDWETQGYKWCKFGEWPHPLHFGLKGLFNHGPSLETIRKHVS